MFKEPDIFGLIAFCKKQDIGIDACVGAEDSFGQADYGVQIKLREKFPFRA